MMAPAMIGMAVGSMVGRLATRAFGVHDLPIPRQPATVTLIPSNIDEFAADWEIPTDEMRLWVLAHELAGHALLSTPHVRDTLSDSCASTSAGSAPTPTPSSRASASSTAAHPTRWPRCSRRSATPRCCSAPSRRPEQQALRPQLDALVAVVVGYVDWIVDAVSVRIVGGDALRIAEAVRRRRVETSASDSFVEQLLGIRIGEDQVARGKAFVQGVVDRAGDDGLAPLLRPRRRHPDPERAGCSRALAGATGVTRRVSSARRSRQRRR